MAHGDEVRVMTYRDGQHAEPIILGDLAIANHYCPDVQRKITDNV